MFSPAFLDQLLPLPSLASPHTPRIHSSGSKRDRFFFVTHPQTVPPKIERATAAPVFREMPIMVSLDFDAHIPSSPPSHITRDNMTTRAVDTSRVLSTPRACPSTICRRLPLCARARGARQRLLLLATMGVGRERPPGGAHSMWEGCGSGVVAGVWIEYTMLQRHREFKNSCPMAKILPTSPHFCRLLAGQMEHPGIGDSHWA
ncbi:hypothetical protein DFH09DRAFT_1104182 [Mycena vulgaris]|nr:hypothetical protein DFH09DRAFT_1104182 [Mycena vulgaris]